MAHGLKDPECPRRGICVATAPLTEVHAHAELAAESAEAAGAQGKFGEMHDGRVRTGVNGTPTFFVNGARYDGPLDEQSLEAALHQRIARRA